MISEVVDLQIPGLAVGGNERNWRMKGKENPQIDTNWQCAFSSHQKLPVVVKSHHDSGLRPNDAPQSLLETM